MAALQDQSENYEVIHPFTAYFAPNTGEVEDPHALAKGAIVRADVEFGQDNSPESALVVRFMFGDRWFYVDRETFVDCTRKK
jgi:hypothetical protein